MSSSGSPPNCRVELIESRRKDHTVHPAEAAGWCGDARIGKNGLPKGVFRD